MVFLGASVCFCSFLRLAQAGPGIVLVAVAPLVNAKNTYMPVPGNYMIEFTFHTSIEPVADDSLNIPQFVYHLTPFADLAQRAGVYSRFTDVIRVLVEISKPKVVHLSGKAAPTLTRDIILRDLSYFEIKVTLWGHRASAFMIDAVYNADEPKPIIVLLVSALAKTYQGQDYLSGNAACRWYFSPQVPEANPFYASLADQHIEIKHTLPAAAKSRQPIAAQALPATLAELEEMDPYDIGSACHSCKVTISSLVLKERWWFPSCVKCNKSCENMPTMLVAILMTTCSLDITQTYTAAKAGNKIEVGTYVETSRSNHIFYQT
ncbi:hypothetical protein U9M48_038309 [Paspalum notatum var. saurae]|uniref:Replication factor A C-terminal domain-containing protein n=1 Tax=Paspalum notatum var. saurae TaxID=547442 RepID=A0AAQ3XA67_PASNO